MDKLTLDTDKQVFFYEQEFYVLSNFSSFKIRWRGILFPTSEHAYHWESFYGPNGSQQHRDYIEEAASAHEAYQYTQYHKAERRVEWDQIKVPTMRQILLAKWDQHEYVRRKLFETGNRWIIENSWRDDFWGWGPERNGKNVLGQLWMQIRSEKALELDGGQR